MTFETAAKFLADAAQRVVATASCRRLLAIAWWLVRYRLLSAVACWSCGWISVWNTEVWLVVLWLKWIAISQGPDHGSAAPAGGGRTVAAVTPAVASLLNQNLHVQNALL